MKVVLILSLIYMAVLVIYFLVRFCLKDRKERLLYLRSFKKGKFALIYFIAIPLYYFAYMYDTNNVAESIWSSIGSTLALVILRYPAEDVANLAKADTLYNVTVNICFSLVAVNAALFWFSVLSEGLTNNIRKFWYSHFSKKICFVIGYNDNNKKIISSISKSKQYDGVFLVCPLNPDIKTYAYLNKIALVSDNGKIDVLLNKYRKKINNIKIDIIVNTESDEKNLIYTKQINDLIISVGFDGDLLVNTVGLDCYVFGDNGSLSVFLHFVKNTFGNVHFIDKHRLVAMDFVTKYPLTEFLNDTYIDYDSATLKKDVEINCFFIGLGKCNQSILTTSIANNQFIQKADDEIKSKPVHYYVFDKKDAHNEKNLNHTYRRYKQECLDNKEEYLPLPDEPAEIQVSTIDINDIAFYELLKEKLSLTEKAFNYIVISFGKDLENLDLAEKLIDKIHEWQIDNIVKIFVRVRNDDLSNKVLEKEYAGNEDLIFFGNDGEVVYNINKIVNEQQEKMARERNFMYSLLGDEKVSKVKEEILSNKKKQYSKELFTPKEETEILTEANKKWYSWNPVQREANIYGCLSIRFKLQLLGYDLVKDHGQENAVESFLEKYQKGDKIKYLDGMPLIWGKKYIVYTNKFVEGSLRENLSFQEHQRWYAFMITNGIIPSTLKQIEEEGAKNLALRRHSNITTYKGLIDFRKIMAKKNNLSEEETDVIRYDYQIMDDLVWLISRNGYTIVKR